MRDTSLAGQKKVKELQKLLADAQKELDKLTQNKIDSDINDAFDDEMDRIDEENDKLIEELEKLWSDSKIAEMVADSLRTGLFTGIDGSVQDLQDAMLEFAKESGDLFGVMGTVIKSELITNLEIAKDTMRELGEILKELDLDKFSKISSMSSFNSPNGSVSRMGNSSNIEFNSPFIVVQGNVDSNVMTKLESFGRKIKDEIFYEIASAIR